MVSNAGLLGRKYQDLLGQMMRSASNFKRGTTNATEWLMKQAKKMKVTDQQLFTAQAFDGRKHKLIPVTNLGDFQVGRMVLFTYEALDEGDRLPYWDKYPVGFIIDYNLTSKNGRAFRALNMHYLPHGLRAQLLDALYLEYRHGHLDPRKKMQIDYDILKSTTKLKYFKPCFKKYLYKQVRSKFNIVPPLDMETGHDLWAHTMMLEIQNWQKGGTNEQVWKDSRKIIRGK